MKRILLICLALLFLGGCFNENNQSAKDFLKSVKKEKNAKIPPLPEVREYKSANYDVILMKDPFHPYADVVMLDGDEDLIEQNAQLQRPDADRKRELLEYYPLDSFVMVGTIKRGKTFWAILKDKAGILHKVHVGNYIGENSGQVNKITGKEMLVKELMSDGQGSWIERVTTLHMVN